MTHGKCESCAHWAEQAMVAERTGECRRYAPRTTVQEVDRSETYVRPFAAVWPETPNNAGCGEWHPAMAPKVGA